MLRQINKLVLHGLPPNICHSVKLGNLPTKYRRTMRCQCLGEKWRKWRKSHGTKIKGKLVSTPTCGR